MLTIFKEIKQNFGFGCMRLPMSKEEVDLFEFQKMVDCFMSSGFNYFDTARVYTEGKSELALRECLTKKYSRESFVFTDKLSSPLFNRGEDLEPLFNKQLESTGLDYFDFYLIHAVGKRNYQKYLDTGCFDFVIRKKKEGKIKHIGMSFHDEPEFLDEILSTHKEIEVVQIQFNYLDQDNPNVQSRACYEVCVKHNKPIIVMEPVKGGSLVNLTPKAQSVFDELNNGSNASYALRYVASFDQIFMILSGMSDMHQMMDNVSFMKDVKPLSENEFRAVNKVVDYLKDEKVIPCTSCRYCIDGCPKNINIPELFKCYNASSLYRDYQAFSRYNALTENGGKASDCIKCGGCENSCPQHLKIRDYLVKVSEQLERKQ